ncbi:exosome complex component RRP42 [Tanacetum coccineum]|uniref:Ribosomal RNA-processing protein 42 n=1 Tax=Tanacetum coccineum TaxID=301880 RepID=A0ABQ4XHI8_9ASTR
MGAKQYAIKAQALGPQLEGQAVSGLFHSASSCAVVVPVSKFAICKSVCCCGSSLQFVCCCISCAVAFCVLLQFVTASGLSEANGSARVKMGRTEVIASVKRRGGEELSMELSAALRQLLLGGKTGAGAGIDLSSLSIVDGKVCWDLYIDGLVTSMDGNVLDALGAAVKAALSNTGIPKVNVASATPSDEQPKVDVSDEEFLQFDTTAVPVIVTLTKVGRHYIVDATTKEESQMSSAVFVSINRQGLICGLTKRGGACLDPSVILDMIPVAKHQYSVSAIRVLLHFLCCCILCAAAIRDSKWYI